MEAHTQHPPKENGLAVASLVLGILSVVGAGALTGIPAIITGALSLKNPHNKGMGIAGLVMGIISTVLTILLVVIFIVILLVALSVPSSPSSTPTYPQYQDDSPRYLQQQT
jgi:uncharacterized membrane protein